MLQRILELLHFIGIPMNQHNVGWLQLLNILRGVLIISVRRKTYILNGKLLLYWLVIHNYGLGSVHDLLGQGALHTVPSKYDAILHVGCPLHKQLPALTVLKHTRTCHYNKWIRRFIIKSGNRFELEGVVTTFEVHPELVSHHVSVCLEHCQTLLSQTPRVVYGDIGQLWVLLPVLIQDE